MTKLGLLEVGGTKHALHLGETYFVGNKSNYYSHDIEIDDASVDLKHCIFDCAERLPKLFDLRSKCGTFVDGIRVAACQMIPLVKSSPIQFGNIEATFQLLSEGDSGFLEGRLTSPPKDTSAVICNSPEQVASSIIRLKQRATTITNNVINDASVFLIPTKIPRKSVGSSTSARSVDSFYIPETQHPAENEKGAKHSINASIGTNQSANIGGESDEDDDFFIPETQDIGKLSNYPRVAFNNGDISEPVADDDKIPSSQFRICTQDFNGSDDNLSNNSDDILANVSCSQIIPQIHHSPVRIDDIISNRLDDEEIEKEMSALQWSKRTGEDGEGSVTCDVINPVNGTITPDIIEHVGKVIATAAVALCNTPDMFANPDQSDCDKADKSIPEVPQDLQPTQAFVRPASISNSFIKPPCDKENIGPLEDDLFLPSTQVFMPPPVRIKPATSFPTPPPPPPTPMKVSSFLADDDLPPTQVFQKEDAAPTTAPCFSSTLIDMGMQLSENSFRAKCNKFLDSDDDEMDEVIAPELVKKMRESVKQHESPVAPPTVESFNSTPIVVKSPQIEKKTEKTPQEETKSVSKNKGYVKPKTTTKKISQQHAAVSVDKFLFTPDFLGEEFSKDKKLQELAEVNWKNIISENQRKTLFGPSSDESDDSQDSFNDLLPNKLNSVAEKLEKTAASEKEKQKPEGRLTRRRKSMFEEESKNKKVRKKADTNGLIQLVSDNKEKKDSDTKKEVMRDDDSHQSKGKLKESHKEKSVAPDKKEKKKSSTKKRDVAPAVELNESKAEVKESAKEESSALASNAHTDRTQKATEKKERKKYVKKGDQEDKESTTKKYETKSKQEEEAKPSPRLTRLRSAKELATKKAEVEVPKELSDRKKNSTETSRDSSDKPKQAAATSKDSSHNRKPKVDAKPTSSGSTEATKPPPKTLKRDKEMPEALAKRLRSNNSTDSVVSSGSIESRRLRRAQKPKIAMTMCDPRYQGVLEKHSGALWIYTKDPKECDVMVVEKGNRTFKIMVAIARGIAIVKLDWLIEVLKRKSVDIPYEQYLFEDPEFQNRHQFDMKKSLHLARTTSLLEGISFFMTPGIRPIPKEMKDIIVCAGGTVLEDVSQHQENDKIYLVSETKDQKHWHQYRRMNPNIKIVSSEGVMASVMQQSKSPLKKSVIV